MPLRNGDDFFDELTATVTRCWPRPKLMILNFPHNPTTAIVNLAFMKRVVDFARENGILVVHDFAYADLCFDGYKAPSIMQVPGAQEIVRRVLHPLEKLQHARMARRLLRRQSRHDRVR